MMMIFDDGDADDDGDGDDGHGNGDCDGDDNESLTQLLVAARMEICSRWEFELKQ